jgi:hypothetical protein
MEDWQRRARTRSRIDQAVSYKVLFDPLDQVDAWCLSGLGCIFQLRGGRLRSRAHLCAGIERSRRTDTNGQRGLEGVKAEPRSRWWWRAALCIRAGCLGDGACRPPKGHDGPTGHGWLNSRHLIAHSPLWEGMVVGYNVKLPGGMASSTLESGDSTRVAAVRIIENGRDLCQCGAAE